MSPIHAADPTYLRERRDELSSQLDAVYRRIHEQAPDAAILVLGYPQLFPASTAEQNCAKLSQKDYFLRNGRRLEQRSIGFSQTEQNYMRQATSEANQLIAARVNESAAATFVPVDSFFAGHEICGNSGEWINGPSGSKDLRANDQSFHPNAYGQRLGYAEVINNWINPPLPEF